MVDAAIVDGVASLMTFFTGLANNGRISLSRERNLLGGAAPFYRCYLCRDGREVAIGPLEPAFFAVLMTRLGREDLIEAQYDETRWGELAGALAGIIASQDQAHWTALLAETDACVAPVLNAAEVARHPHHVARESYLERDGITQAAPAPRLSHTPGAIRSSEDTDALVRLWQG